MKKIPLTMGKHALVDDEDYEELMKHEWRCATRCYAVRWVYIEGKRTLIWMHRVILGLVKGDSKETDHIDGDGLNNQRHNLRAGTHKQNGHNLRPRKKQGTSRYKGVCWHKIYKRWLASIGVNNKKINLGYFDDEKEAALAYDEAARKYHGEFARCNFEQEQQCMS